VHTINNTSNKSNDTNPEFSNKTFIIPLCDEEESGTEDEYIASSFFAISLASR
jgi:hypothetical protein